MRFKKYFCTLFIVGLVIRLTLSYHMGNHDMSAYYAWGNNVLEKGLSNSYYGVYFPIQYQLFSLYSWVAKISGIVRWMIVFKVFNLLFEIGVFALLVKLLDKFRVSRNYAFIYWFHPWFLVNFSQGFIDGQLSFFVLLSILGLYDSFKKNEASSYIISGIPYAIAFLLKPQILMPSFALFVFFSLFSLRHKVWKNLFFFMPTFGLFAVYSIYFALAHFFTAPLSPNHLDLANGFLVLRGSYLGIINVMPCLTCSMPNFWYPIARFLSGPDQPVYVVTSRIFVIPGITVEKVALFAVIMMIIHFCHELVALKNHENAEKILRLILFVTILTPFLMTGAHVNHPYLGTILLIPYLAKYRNVWFRIAGHTLLLAISGYTYVAYGFGMNFSAVPDFVRHVPLVYFAFASIAGFTYVLWYLSKTTLSKTG